MSAIEPQTQAPPVAERITVVLRAPEGKTLEQVLPFVQLGAPVSIGRGLAVIAGASDRDLVTPYLDHEFSIDDHVRLVADAKRYRHLRDKICVEDADNDLMVVRGDRYFDGAELDIEIDNALRLTRLEELHP
ncbi:hypothetical protein AB3967_14130 [Pseudomonas rhodesiae]|uniref:hypothetical protein n=1 Tax=Pseudomonas rhodesiae TaxID=76760 RepID=UPI00161E399F